MFNKTYSAAVAGIDGLLVQVEADVSDGLPEFSMVGFLSSEVREAKERVRIALKNAGYKIPAKRITINLSPADVRKEGTAFDLPIAIAILTTLGFLPEQTLENTLIIGELSLNGSVNNVTGVLPIVSMAAANGFTRCILPKGNAKEGSVVEDIDVIGVDSLEEVVKYLNGARVIEPEYTDLSQLYGTHQEQLDVDFSDINGQLAAKRAVEVAVSGMHNILFIGSPGAGKTMLAKRIPTIMPDLSVEESLEISKVYSITGMLNNQMHLVTKRPFRSPHHTISQTALVGGGRNAKPGELSLASGGVLFLDELPEFQKTTLEVLRQPLEDKKVTVTRLNANYQYPAKFMLVAAMNPCNCGYYPDRSRCNCAIPQVQRYLGKISRPLLDRIDLCIETLPITYTELDKRTGNETSMSIRARVMKAREIQKARYANEHIHFNSELTPALMQTYCVLGKEEKEFLEKIYHAMNLSARAYHRIIKVARTIADLEECETISMRHLSEAVCYRSADKFFGQENGTGYGRQGDVR